MASRLINKINNIYYKNIFQTFKSFRVLFSAFKMPSVIEIWQLAYL